MKQLLVELEDDVAARLEQVAPGRSRLRSEFVRAAIRRALWDLEEQAVATAYRRTPDPPAEPPWDPALWESRGKAGKRPRR